MMKKFLAIFFAAFYLVITIGIPISVHHCHGQNQISVSLSDENSCSCAITTEEPSCCSTELEAPSHCHLNHHETGCCTHDFKVLVWEDHQQIIQKEEFHIDIIELDLHQFYNNFNSESEIVENKLATIIQIQPPPQTVPIQVLHQEFIFYG